MVGGGACSLLVRLPGNGTPNTKAERESKLGVQMAPRDVVAVAGMTRLYDNIGITFVPGYSQRKRVRSQTTQRRACKTAWTRRATDMQDSMDEASDKHARQHGRDEPAREVGQDIEVNLVLG